MEQHHRKNGSGITVAVPGRPDVQRANRKNDALGVAVLATYLLHGHLNQFSSVYLLSLTH